MTATTMTEELLIDRKGKPVPKHGTASPRGTTTDHRKACYKFAPDGTACPAGRFSPTYSIVDTILLLFQRVSHGKISEIAM